MSGHNLEETDLNNKLPRISYKNFRAQNYGFPETNAPFRHGYNHSAVLNFLTLLTLASREIEVRFHVVEIRKL